MLRSLAIFMLLAALTAGIWLGWALWLPEKPPQDRILLLQSGWSTRHIAAELKRAGVLRSPNAFLLYHYLTHPQTLKAGEYRFDQAANAMEVHARLVEGDVLKRAVVIPEGFTMFDIALAVEKAGLGSRSDFLAVARQETALVSDMDPHAESLEGYMFPDTYQFMRTQSMTDIVSAMVRRFRQEARATGLLPATGAISQIALPAGMDVHRLVTLASIVEKETGVAEERPLVASVYYNRLAKKIALNADPTVIYAALLGGRYDGAIHRSDLESTSPYNTYKYNGLPPGPIANPGRAALQAVLHPASTGYFYFVSDANGRHRFAHSLDEHSRNVVLYRRARAAENR